MTDQTPAHRNLDEFMATIAAPEFRRLILDGVAAELRGLRHQLEVRAIREGGPAELTINDLTARIAQVPGMLLPATVKFVPSDTPTTRAEPKPGMRILINNAGGDHQNPGSYGYTETVVYEVETDTQPGTGRTLTRLRTDAYGWGCWSSGTDSVKVRA